MENMVNKINDDIEALILNHDQISNLAEKFIKTKDIIMNYYVVQHVTPTQGPSSELIPTCGRDRTRDPRSEQYIPSA